MVSLLKKVPSFVLSQKKQSSTYPRERAGLGRLGDERVKYRYASGCFWPAALLADLFEQPARQLE
jgi:hypothetical protein